MNYYASAFNLCRGSCSVDLETKGCFRDKEVCYPIFSILNITGPGFQHQATGMKTSVYIICKVSRRESYSG